VAQEAEATGSTPGLAPTTHSIRDLLAAASNWLPEQTNRCVNYWRPLSPRLVDEYRINRPVRLMKAGCHGRPRRPEQFDDWGSAFGVRRRSDADQRHLRFRAAIQILMGFRTTSAIGQATNPSWLKLRRTTAPTPRSWRGNALIAQRDGIDKGCCGHTRRRGELITLTLETRCEPKRW